MGHKRCHFSGRIVRAKLHETMLFGYDPNPRLHPRCIFFALSLSADLAHSNIPLLAFQLADPVSSARSTPTDALTTLDLSYCNLVYFSILPNPLTANYFKSLNLSKSQNIIELYY